MKYEYKRTVHFVTDDVEVVEIEWLPGQASPIHRHGMCSGMVTVLEGAVHEELYDDDGEMVRLVSERDHTQGDRFAEEALGIHRISKRTKTIARTLHVYMPPPCNEAIDESLLA